MLDTRSNQTSSNGADVAEFDAVVVGAGLAGLYMLYRLRGLGLSVRVVEAGTGVGGTWYWNRYPGARCDTESMDYSYSFSEELQQEWSWSERYASQPEILRYINHVADRFDLRRDIQFNTRVEAATYNEETSRWDIRTESGDMLRSTFCIMATGCLSSAQVPQFKGLDSFAGDWYHTGSWPHHEVDFTGKRVAVIGTGSSGIQSIPIIARQAEHLYVFQRTPNFSIPAWNGPLDPNHERWIKENYAEYRRTARESRRGYAVPFNEKSALEVGIVERRHEYEMRWAYGGLHMLTAFNDLYTSREANDTAAEFVRSKIREIVRDQAVAKKLLPHDHPIGSKRICVDTGYYDTYNRENVTLVDIRSAPIEEITPQGVRTTESQYDVDAIVFATGFDAMTGTLLKIDITGKDGARLRDAWAAGPRTYLGLAVSGFPNLFTVTGPGSPSVIGNMSIAIEQHVDWIADCIEYVSERNIRAVEASGEAQDRWVDHVNEVASTTLYPQANSWYMGANIPGKQRVFMPYVGGVGAYRKICDDIAHDDYRGFTLTPS